MLHGPENPIQPPRTSREKGWISPASQGACRVTVPSRHDHGVRPAFEVILRRLQRTRLRTCHYVSLKKNPTFFFLQKQCAACLAVLHKQLLANTWTNIQVKERERGTSPACLSWAQWLLWKRWISWTMKKLPIPKFLEVVMKKTFLRKISRAVLHSGEARVKFRGTWRFCATKPP